MPLSRSENPSRDGPPGPFLLPAARRAAGFSYVRPDKPGHLAREGKDMATSMPLGTEGRPNATTRLRVVEELENRRARNEVRSLLANTAMSARRRLRLAAQSIQRSRFLGRVASWLRRVQRRISPITRPIGIATPLWVVTDRRGQRAIGVAGQHVGRAIRETAHRSSDLVTWVLWRFGGGWQHAAHRYSFFVERAVSAAESLAGRTQVWAAKVRADRPVIRIINRAAAAVMLLDLASTFTAGGLSLGAGLLAAFITAATVAGNLQARTGNTDPTTAAAPPATSQAIPTSAPTRRSNNARNRRRSRR